MPSQFLGAQATGRLEEIAVNGYPDGTFKPEANVTYAEALKMILCALGYTPETFRSITWPVTWIAKAMELKITDGVALATGASGLPANRADVARLVDNSLTVPKLVQVGYGDEIKYVVSGTGDVEKETLMGNLGCTEIKGRMIDAGILLDSKLADNAVVVDKDGDGAVDDGEEYTVASDINVASLVGLKVTAWVNEEGEIFLVTGTDAASVIEDDVYEVELAADTDDLAKVKLGDEADYKTYDVASNAVLFINHTVKNPKSVSSGDKSTLEASRARVILNDKKEAVMIYAVDYAESSIVSEVVVKHQLVKFKGGAGSLDLADVDYHLYRNGAPAKLEDLREDDIVWVWKNDAEDEAYVVALSNQVAGTLEAASSDWKKVTIGGKTCEVADNGQYSTDGGDSVAEDTILNDMPTDLLGEQVTAYLDNVGKVRWLVGDVTPAEGAEQYVLVWDVAQVSGLDLDVYVRVWGADGAKHDYKLVKGSKLAGLGLSGEFSFKESTDSAFDDDSNLSTTADQVLDDEADVEKVLFRAEGPDVQTQVSTLELNPDGTVKRLVLAEATKPEVEATDDDIDEANDRIRLEGFWYAVDSQTVIFDARTTTDVKAANWAAIEEAASAVTVSAKLEGGKAKVLIVTEGILRVAKETGVVLAKEVVAGGQQRLTVDVAGQTKAYTFKLSDLSSVTGLKDDYSSGDYTDIEKGEVVSLQFKASGAVDSIAELKPADLDAETAAQVFRSAVQSVSPSAYRVEVLDNYYYGDAATQVYDCSGTTPKNVGWGALSVADVVELYLGDDGVIDVVRILASTADTQAPAAPRVDATNGFTLAAGSEDDDNFGTNGGETVDVRVGSSSAGLTEDITLEYKVAASASKPSADAQADGRAAVVKSVAANTVIFDEVKLTAADQHVWVRAVDASGNTSDWVDLGGDL